MGLQIQSILHGGVRTRRRTEPGTSNKLRAPLSAADRPATVADLSTRSVAARLVAGSLFVVLLAGIALGQAAPSEAARQAMQDGAAAMKAEHFTQAVEAYRAATRELPAFAEGYMNLGLALDRAGRLDESRTAFEQALRLKPTLRGGNLFLGVVLYRMNRFAEAEARLEQETRTEPREAKAWMWLGVCRLASNDSSGATAALDKAFALDPKDPDILYHRGHAHLQVANASYAAMYGLDHDSFRVHQVLGEAYAGGFRNPEAIREFEVAVRMAPEQPGLHEELGDQYWTAGQLDKAAVAYAAELSIDAHAVTASYKLGSLDVLNQKPGEGVVLLQAALEADPGLADAHYYLGAGLAALDRNQEAVHEFQQAIAADPKDDRAMTSYYKLAQLYRKLHDTAAAQNAMADFLRMRAETRERQDRHTAQIVRKRSELPVEDPDRKAIVTGTAEP